MRDHSWDVCMYICMFVSVMLGMSHSCSGTQASLICALHEDVDGGQSWGKRGS